MQNDWRSAESAVHVEGATSENFGSKPNLPIGGSFSSEGGLTCRQLSSNRDDARKDCSNNGIQENVEPDRKCQNCRGRVSQGQYPNGSNECRPENCPPAGVCAAIGDETQHDRCGQSQGGGERSGGAELHAPQLPERKGPQQHPPFWLVLDSVVPCE